MSQAILDQIKQMEDKLKKTQYNKATEHHFGVVKAQIARLREKIETNAAKGKKGEGFFVKKAGDATVVLLGFPSVGKSTLLNVLTNAKSATAAYLFTTLTVIPGLLEHKQAKIQILDVPGVIEGAAAGRGRGKEVLAMVRSCDLILIVIDAQQPEQLDALMRELYAVNVRADQERPDIKITKKPYGGLRIASTVKLTQMSKETIESVFREFKINNADVVLRTDATVDQLIDAIAGNRAYILTLRVVTKADLVGEKELMRVIANVKPHVVVSATTKMGIPGLKEKLYNRLSFVRIFLKEINKKPDLDVPMVLLRGATIRSVCDKLHRDFAKKFKFAKIWGSSAKFPGQLFRTLDKQLADGDIVEIHLR